MKNPAASSRVSEEHDENYRKVVTPLRYNLSFDTPFARYSGRSDFHNPFVPSGDLGSRASRDSGQTDFLPIPQGLS